MNWDGFGSGNGLSSVRRQAITWTNADLLSIGPLEKTLRLNSNRNTKLWFTICIWKFRLGNGGHFVRGGGVGGNGWVQTALQMNRHLCHFWIDRFHTPWNKHRIYFSKALMFEVSETVLGIHILLYSNTGLGYSFSAFALAVLRHWISGTRTKLLVLVVSKATVWLFHNQMCTVAFRVLQVLSKKSQGFNPITVLASDRVHQSE